MSEQTQITEQPASPVETTKTPTETKQETTTQHISATTEQPKLQRHGKKQYQKNLETIQTLLSLLRLMR